VSSSGEFEAFLVTRRGDGSVDSGVRYLRAGDLGDGDVLVRVEWSSVNYKDMLAASPGGQVARLDSLVPGIDLAGVVADPGRSGLKAGTQVVVHGYGLGVAHHGGFSAFARVPAGWVVPLPDGLDTRAAMCLGTAGFTAALSVARLESHGLRPDHGPVLVTGATGGVGSTAVGMLAARGYEVVASSGKADAGDWLTSLGAQRILGRIPASGRALEQERWAAAVDCVGGETLARVLAALRYGCAVAASGNTGGPQLATTVFPFILRGVSLLGIDSANHPLDRRREIWARMASDLRPPDLDALVEEEVMLDALGPALDKLRRGQARGRTLVRLTHEDPWAGPA
jgi:acrylyl-CoA reductase (NADPH)